LEVATKSRVFRVEVQTGLYVSEEYTAFIFRVKEEAKQEASRSRRQAELACFFRTTIDPIVPGAPSGIILSPRIT
jgi:hypothetical protein